MENTFKRAKVKRNFALIFVDILFLLVVEAILFFVLFYYGFDPNGTNPLAFLKFFGYGQIAIVLLFGFTLVVQDNDLLRNNQSLTIDPIEVKEKSVLFSEKNKKEEIPYADITSVAIIRQFYFSFKMHHIVTSSYGKLQLLTKDKKTHLSGYVDNPQKVKEIIEAKISNTPLSH